MSKRFMPRREFKKPKAWPGRKTRKYRKEQLAEENKLLQRELAPYADQVLQEPDIANLHFRFMKATGRKLPRKKFENRIKDIIRSKNPSSSADRATTEAA